MESGATFHDCNGGKGHRLWGSYIQALPGEWGTNKDIRRDAIFVSKLFKPLRVSEKSLQMTHLKKNADERKEELTVR